MVPGQDNEEAHKIVIVNMTAASVENCRSSYSGTRPVRIFLGMDLLAYLLLFELAVRLWLIQKSPRV